jgi:pimeloyl-ACP methyl ester carboxylesterase
VDDPRNGSHPDDPRHAGHDDAPEAVRRHRDAGRFVQVRGRDIFVRDEGEGPPILLMHGVPASSFLYRKVLPLLAAGGRRAIAFDLPGLGLSAKPTNTPYDWHALAGWVGDIVEALELPPVHLVVHGIAGPVGMEWAIGHPDRVKRITISNGLFDLQSFRKPFPMSLFPIPLLGRVAFSAITVAAFGALMRRTSVLDPAAFDDEAAHSYLWLLRRGGGRRAFLAIMSGFDMSARHQTFLVEGLNQLDLPMQIVWGRHDRAVPPAQREFMAEQLGIDRVHLLDARHFPQEDQAEACVEHIMAFDRN